MRIAKVVGTVTLSRSYRDGDQWKYSESLWRDDLPLAAKLLDQAHTWIYECNMRKEGE